ncbi:interleukin-17D isoform X1 [Chlorocebus sabaeus]|uniref:interleukin-17D isoform X1 n=1 Tax=Chlorocebus sabaeus TaxID=60711 RepID=UPI0018B04D2A|nr:interleukin-17D isoform X1 [Chlorocebus sabaeus]
MLGALNLLRPGEVPQVPARSLLPVPGLPDRAVRRGGRAFPQRPGLHAHRGAAPHPRLRRRPVRLHRGLRHHPRGLHLRPRAGEGRRQHQLQHRQTGRQAPAGPQRRARRPLRPVLPRRSPGPRPEALRLERSGGLGRRPLKSAHRATTREHPETRLTRASLVALSHKQAGWLEAYGRRPGTATLCAARTEGLERRTEEPPRAAAAGTGRASPLGACQRDRDAYAF